MATILTLTSKVCNSVGLLNIRSMESMIYYSYMISIIKPIFRTLEVELKKPKGKHIWTAKVGEKGQIVIPKQARDVFNIQPGDTLVLLGDEEQGIAIVKQDWLSNFSELIMKPPKPSDEDL